MDKLLYLLARIVVGSLQALPFLWVARFGRVAGGLFYFLDARHRNVALKNLHLCFGAEKSPETLRALAQENFRRIGENFCCAAKTAGMTFEQLQERIDFVGAEKLASKPGAPLNSYVVAIGHFGNFELYARLAQFMPAFKAATTYRGVRQPSLNRLMQDLRERSGCVFFERRTDAAALKAAMAEPGMLLGLLADQHAGNNGLRIPFFGHECSTSAAPALFALRYRTPLLTAICYRTGMARWRIEAGEEIPTHENGAVRSIEAIMGDVNRAFEKAIRRDPANWFWVHNRWKPRTMRTRPTRIPAGEAVADDH